MKNARILMELNNRFLKTYIKSPRRNMACKTAFLSTSTVFRNNVMVIIAAEESQDIKGLVRPNRYMG